jgi:hypothetical protein
MGIEPMIPDSQSGYLSNLAQRRNLYAFALVGVLGIGPRITGSKPVVLPLHYTPILVLRVGIEPTLQKARLKA